MYLIIILLEEPCGSLLEEEEEWEGEDGGRAANIEDSPPWKQGTLNPYFNTDYSIYKYYKWLLKHQGIGDQRE